MTLSSAACIFAIGNMTRPKLIIDVTATREVIRCPIQFAPGRRAARTVAIGKSYIAARIHRSFLVRNRDIGDKQRFAYRLSRKRRALLEPGARRGRAPQGLPARIPERPAHRLMIVVASEIIAGVEFEAMAVGVANVQKERVGDAVA